MMLKDLAVLLVVVVLASAVPHTKRLRDDNKKCDYCAFYDKTGMSPYELLWTVASEISPVMNEAERGELLMTPDDLKRAEVKFEEYCLGYCPKEFKMDGNKHKGT